MANMCATLRSDKDVYQNNYSAIWAPELGLVRLPVTQEVTDRRWGGSAMDPAQSDLGR
jgi:hypothetical protein